MKPLDYLAQMVLEDGRRWVDAAVDFQIQDAHAVIAGDRPYSFNTRARGSSKTSDLSVVVLSELLASERPLRAYWLAADADQGQLAIDVMQRFAVRSPGIDANALEFQSRRVLAPRSDSRLVVLPADAPGAWGLNPDLVVVDELANWADGPAARRLWEAAFSSVAKRADSRLVILSTSGAPDHFAKKILDTARSSPLWRVNEVAGPSPWADPARLEDQRRQLPESVFRQLFRNEWIATEGSFIDAATLDAAFRLDGPSPARPGRRYFAALDLGSVNDRTAFAVGHVEPGDQEVRLDRMQTWKGSRLRPVDFSEVEEYIVAAHGMFGFDLRLDPWQGLDLAQRLRKRGIAATEFTFSQGSKQRLASTLLHQLNSGHLALYEADGLREELLALRVVQASSGAWGFDHTRRGHDDRAVALALMTLAAVERSSIGEAFITTSWLEPGAAAAAAEHRRRTEPDPFTLRVTRREPPPPERVGGFLIHR